MKQLTANVCFARNRSGKLRRCVRNDKPEVKFLKKFQKSKTISEWSDIFEQIIRDRLGMCRRNKKDGTVRELPWVKRLRAIENAFLEHQKAL